MVTLTISDINEIYVQLGVPEYQAINHNFTGVALALDSLIHVNHHVVH
jgi:hypothetical protein